MDSGLKNWLPDRKIFAWNYTITLSEGPSP
jgi:hypothetical protein